MYVPPPDSHAYDLCRLNPGDYAFTFQAWGKSVDTIKFTVAPYTTPVVSVIAAEPIATEPVRGGPQPRIGMFKVIRAGASAGDITVRLKVSGTATHGSDYLFGAFDAGPFTDEISITIPEGYSWLPIPVLPKADTEVEGVESVILTVEPADTYSVGVPETATVKILDTRTPILRTPNPADPTRPTDLPVQLPPPGTRLDVAGSELIVSLPDRDAFPDMLAYINDLVKSGRNSGAWDGAGIVTSAATGRLSSLAIVPNEQDNTIIVKQTWAGDMDLNGRIDADDYFQIDSGFLSQYRAQPLRGYRNGDIDYSGTIDADDYYLIDSAFLAQQRTASAPMSSTARPQTAKVRAPFSKVRVKSPHRRPAPLRQ